MLPSPQLINRRHSILCVIDVQQRLFPIMHQPESLQKNLKLLVEAGNLFDIPQIVTEQYPAGLGPTIPGLVSDSTTIIEKRDFSVRDAESGFLDVLSRLADTGKNQIVLAGIEAHICVTQSALDLINHGFHVFLVTDAIASRNAKHIETTLSRISQAGGIPVTTESVLFEWTESSRDDKFKAISRLVR